MMDEALSGAGTQRGPEPGWYPDPVGRAAHRYWNGTEWTANTRGPAPSPTPVEAVPASTTPSVSSSLVDAGLVEPSPVRAADPMIAQPVRVGTRGNASIDTDGPEAQRSLFGAASETPSTGAGTPSTGAGTPSTGAGTPSTGAGTPSTGAGTPSTGPGPTGASRERMAPSLSLPSTSSTSSESMPDVAEVPDGGSRWLASLLGALLIASLGFAGGLAVQRFVLDDPVFDTATPPTTQATTAATTASTPDTDDQVAELAAELERLEGELASVVAERDQALAAAASGGDTGALEAQIANLETHVDTMRGWFTTAILDAADAAFEAEVSRACAAEAEPTLDSTSYTNRMEPAGTHADIVAAALVCREEGG